MIAVATPGEAVVPAATGSRRVPELDALRGLAAGVVLLFHLHPTTFFYGWAGVDLFFVLSGYLITSIILRYSREPAFLVNFYARRSLRIWPIYYLTLALLVAINPLIPRPEPLTAWPYYLTYTQNVWYYWTNNAVPFHTAFDHTWTLALEEQFYLIWPLLVMLAGRRRTIYLGLAAAFVAYAFRTGGILTWEWYSERILIARCDGFALGGVLAALLAADRTARDTARLRLGLAATAIVALVYLVGGCLRFGNGWLGLPTPVWPGLTILAFAALFTGVIGLVVLDAGRPWLAPLRLQPLVGMGQVSYGLYLYHYPIYWALDGFTFDMSYQRPLWADALRLALSLGVAVGSWYLIEKPILGLKERFGYEKRRGSGSAEPSERG